MLIASRATLKSETNATRYETEHFYFSARNSEFKIFKKFTNRCPACPNDLTIGALVNCAALVKAIFSTYKTLPNGRISTPSWLDSVSYSNINIISSLFRYIHIFILKNQVTTTPTGPELLPRDTPVCGLFGRPDSS